MLLPVAPVSSSSALPSVISAPAVVTAPGSAPGPNMDAEKKIRREIANSNERRRMQSINAGFQSLRTLLPHHEGEKLSKAAILQQTAEYIYSLEQEKTRLLAQNCHLKRLLSLSQQHTDANDAVSASNVANSETEMAKRRKRSNEEDTAPPATMETTILTTVVPPEVKKMVSELPLQSKDLLEKLKKPEPQPQPQQQHCRLIVSSATPALVTANPPSAPPAPTAMVVTGATIAPARRQILISEPKPQTAPAAPQPQPQHANLSKEELKPTATLVAAAAHAPKSFVVTGANANVNANNAGGAAKQSLDSIVEAIKHLEGDHLFSEEQGPQNVST